MILGELPIFYGAPLNQILALILYVFLYGLPRFYFAWDLRRLKQGSDVLVTLNFFARV